ncbi:P-loop containing nucleoside triphosphate hydrolase protein [Cladochytrium replicatum]|nr:P-loop containing nucleoside triphosphate hydrolase protein [Cladochytrium replicatum]
MENFEFVNPIAARLLAHREPFLENAARFAETLPDPDPFPSDSDVDAVTTFSSMGNTDDDAAEVDMTVCVRVRPLLQRELERGFFPAVVANNPKVFVHTMAFNHQGPGALRTNDYNVDYCFGEREEDERIYRVAVRSLILLVLGGGVATLFAYGQTGSGKTYTMTAMEERVARDIFLFAHEYRRQRGDVETPSDADFTMKFCFFEIFGSQAFDLLNDREDVQIMEDAFGSIQVVNVLEEQVTSSEQLLSLIARGAKLRRTEQTQKNHTSSRSHAICRIRITNNRIAEAEDGILYLIDLAGSESASDMTEHSKERLAETREINKSLAVLKDCIRNRALALTSRGDKHIHIPYRNSKLTVLLKEAFELASRRQCRTVVFANISPSITDNPASLNTLRYVQPLKIDIPRVPVPSGPDPKNPMTWNNTYLREWVTKRDASILPDILCPFESGKQILRLPEGEFLERCLRCPGVEEKRAKAFYVKLWSLLIDARTADRKKKLKARAPAPSSKQQDEEDLARQLKEIDDPFLHSLAGSAASKSASTSTSKLPTRPRGTALAAASKNSAVSESPLSIPTKSTVAPAAGGARPAVRPRVAQTTSTSKAPVAVPAYKESSLPSPVSVQSALSTPRSNSVASITDTPPDPYMEGMFVRLHPTQNKNATAQDAKDSYAYLIRRSVEQNGKKQEVFWDVADLVEANPEEIDGDVPKTWSGGYVRVFEVMLIDRRRSIPAERIADEARFLYERKLRLYKLL